MVENKYGETFEDLRKKAEEVLKDKNGLPSNRALEIDELIHELEVHQIELEMQNEELVTTQMELENSRREYYELYDFAPVGYFTLDENVIIKRVNLLGAEILGKPRKYLINEALIRFISPSSKKTFHEHFQEVKRNQLKKRCQIKLISDNKIPFFLSLDTDAVLDEKGNFKGFRTTLTDISERKKMEGDIEDSLKEKELLLKEIHHRVKNNLQVISSLLNMQSRYIRNKTDKELFRESQTRAKSMALIHERLYQSTDLRRIDFGEYIQTLTYDLYHSYGGNPKFIKLNMALEPIMVDINTAVPCGLIVNELLSNVLKHAFPQGKTGDLTIKFYSNDGNLVLIVRDEGVGFPEDIDFRNTESLGLSLVNTLVGQIDGEIEIMVDHGTEFKITFPEVKFDE